MIGLIATADGLTLLAVALLPLIVLLARKQARPAGPAWAIAAMLAVIGPWLYVDHAGRKAQAEATTFARSTRYVAAERAAERAALFGREIDDRTRREWRERIAAAESVLASSTAKPIGQGEALIALDRLDEARAITTDDRTLARLYAMNGDWAASMRHGQREWERAKAMDDLRREAPKLSLLAIAAVIGPTGSVGVSQSEILPQIADSERRLRNATEVIAEASAAIDSGRTGLDYFRRTPGHEERAGSYRRALNVCRFVGSP